MSDEEEVVCRICRTGQEAGQLYSPCKCTGSIGSLHEQCLFEWLNSRRGKELCEVCKTPYKFTKVYASNVPVRLPLWILLKRLILSALWLVATLSRAALVAFCWIAVLPYCTVWIFRFYVYSGHNCAAILSSFFVANSSLVISSQSMLSENRTLSSNATMQLPVNATAAELHEYRVQQVSEFLSCVS
jgi:E3 ubiquitin-protein ligase DOA10